MRDSQEFYFNPARWHHGWMKGFLILPVLLILLFGTPVFAGYEEGLAAADREDYATALKEFKSLADQGDASGQNGLGWLYNKGYGVEHDTKVAFELYTLSANQGFAKAQRNLGWMYFEGHGVIQDYKAAIKWYKLAAKQGFDPAQYALGAIYRNGYGVTQDYRAAIKWYKLAAKQRNIFDRYNPSLYSKKGKSGNNVYAQFDLGIMYEEGQGVIQDYKAAGKWYKLAAEQSNTSAQVKLGNMYLEGKGVIQDYTRAHMWLNIAGSQGDKYAAENRDMVEKRMTPSQIEKAQDLARKCVAKNYKDC